MGVTITGAGERELVLQDLIMSLEVFLRSFLDPDLMDLHTQGHPGISKLPVLRCRVVLVRRDHQYRDVLSVAGYIGDRVAGAQMFVMPVLGQAM